MKPVIRDATCKACGHYGRCEVDTTSISLRSYCADKLNCQKRSSKQRKGGPGRPKK